MNWIIISLTIIIGLFIFKLPLIISAWAQFRFDKAEYYEMKEERRKMKALLNKVYDKVVKMFNDRNTWPALNEKQEERLMLDKSLLAEILKYMTEECCWLKDYR